MSSNHPPHSIALLPRVQEAVTEAAYLASGYDISEIKACHVQLSSNYRNSGDMKTNVAAALFLMHTGRNKKEEENNADSINSEQNGIPMKDTRRGRVMEVLTTSRLGLEAPRRYMDGESSSSLSLSCPISHDVHSVSHQ